jgi:hypothetical protein
MEIFIVAVITSLAVFFVLLRMVGAGAWEALGWSALVTVALLAFLSGALWLLWGYR